MNRIALIASLVALGLAGFVAFDRLQPRSGSADPRVDQLQAKVDGLEKTLTAQAKLIGGPAPAGTGASEPAAPDGDRVAALERKVDALAAELAPILGMLREQKAMEAKLSPEANAAFAADFEKQEGVKKTASGLMYRVVKPGPDGGKSPSATSEVTVHYEGKLVDGQSSIRPMPGASPRRSRSTR